MFESLGCELYEAADGAAALRQLEAHPEIQLMFTDVKMPGMDGVELAQRALQLRPKLKIILASGYVQPERVPRDLPFVAKPYRLPDVTRAFEQLR